MTNCSVSAIEGAPVRLQVGAGTEVPLDALGADGDSEPGLLRLLRGLIGIDAPTPAFRWERTIAFFNEYPT